MFTALVSVDSGAAPKDVLARQSSQSKKITSVVIARHDQVTYERYFEGDASTLWPGCGHHEHQLQYAWDAPADGPAAVRLYSGIRQAMTDSERAFAIQQMIEGRDALLRAITGVSEKQAQFRPRPDGWSIADCVEHIAITEAGLFALVEKGAANPQGVALNPEKDGRFARAVVDRSRKVAAPEGVRPGGRFRSVDEARQSFLASRERAIAYARECAQDLRSLFTTHPLLGEIDCYRCLLLLALHPARHAAQIEEIKLDPAFPKA